MVVFPVSNTHGYRFRPFVCTQRLLAGSPQSTLSGIGSWSGKSMVSSNGSPTGPSRVSSPPTSMFGAINDNLDLIYAAAGQTSRIKMSSDEAIRGYHDNIGLLGSSYDSSASSLRNSNPCFFANQVLTRTLPQVCKFVSIPSEIQDQTVSIWPDNEIIIPFICSTGI